MRKASLRKTRRKPTHTENQGTLMLGGCRIKRPRLVVHRASVRSTPFQCFGERRRWTGTWYHLCTRKACRGPAIPTLKQRARTTRPVAIATAAGRILQRLQTKALPSTFTARELKRREWSGLTDGMIVDRALHMLANHGWLLPMERETQGHWSKDYTAHPSIFENGQGSN